MCDLRKALRRPTWRTLRVLNVFIVTLLVLRLVTVTTVALRQGPSLAPFAWCCAAAAVVTDAVLGLLWITSPLRAIAPARAVVSAGIHVVSMLLELAAASALRIPPLAIVGLVAFYAAVATSMYFSVALAQGAGGTPLCAAPRPPARTAPLADRATPQSSQRETGWARWGRRLGPGTRRSGGRACWTPSLSLSSFSPPAQGTFWPRSASLGRERGLSPGVARGGVLWPRVYCSPPSAGRPASSISVTMAVAILGSAAPLVAFMTSPTSPPTMRW